MDGAGSLGHGYTPAARRQVRSQRRHMCISLASASRPGRASPWKCGAWRWPAFVCSRAACNALLEATPLGCAAVGLGGAAARSRSELTELAMRRNRAAEVQRTCLRAYYAPATPPHAHPGNGTAPQSRVGQQQASSGQHHVRPSDRTAPSPTADQLRTSPGHVPDRLGLDPHRTSCRHPSRPTRLSHPAHPRTPVTAIFELCTVNAARCTACLSRPRQPRWRQPTWRRPFSGSSAS